jgi:hypothetical protein
VAAWGLRGISKEKELTNGESERSNTLTKGRRKYKKKRSKTSNREP